nr:patatin-like phospholipase family protein [uncultured Treponema sp.]
MKWALVLSGGGAAGLAYIGFFKALEELNLPKPDCIVGCSMGAIIGGLYASGKPVREMEAVFEESFDVNRYVGGVHIPLFKHGLNQIIHYGTLITRMLSGTGADSGEKTHKFFLELSGCKSFDDCTIPFFCNALDLCSGKEVVLHSGLLADAMRASSSYPGLFIPVKQNHEMLIDACVMDNTPVWIAREQGYNNILALTFGAFEPVVASELDTSVAVLMRTLACTTAHIALQPNEYPTAFINLISARSSRDFSDPKKQIEFGYHKIMDNKHLLQAFFAEGINGKIQRALLTRKTKKEYSV